MNPWYLVPETFINMVIKIALLFAVTVSNLLVVVIWLSANTRTPISILLSMIAMYDALTILASTTWSVAAYAIRNLYYSKDCYIATVAAILALMFHSLSIISTTFLAIQRCVVCLVPFSGPRLCRMKSTAIFGIVSILTLIIWRLPEIMMHNVTILTINTTDNGTAHICDVVYVFDSQSIIDFWKIDLVLQFIVLHMIPACIITFCMVACIITVNRRKLATSQRRNARTTFMLVLVMLVFVIGEFPSSVLLFYRAFYPQVETWISTRTGVWICNITLVISDLLNIWVYIIMSKQFRQSLRNMLCRRNENIGEQRNSFQHVNIATVS